VLEGRVDDPVGPVDRGAQTLDVVDVAAEGLRPGPHERLGAHVRAAEPDYAMARATSSGTR